MPRPLSMTRVRANAATEQWRREPARIDVETLQESENLPEAQILAGIQGLDIDGSPWVPGQRAPCKVSVESEDQKEDSKLDAEADLDKKGQAEVDKTTGAMRKRASAILKSNERDVIRLDSRRIEIDLSFVKPNPAQARVDAIIQEVIKMYAMIPGEVVPEDGSRKGTFVYRITNGINTPTTDSSECESTRPSAPQKPKLMNAHTELIIEKLRRGIPLKPRFLGAQDRKIGLHTGGFSEQKVRKLLEANPGLELKKMIRYILKQTGDWGKISSLYNLDLD